MGKKNKKSHRATLRIPNYIWEYIQSFRDPKDYPKGEIPSITEIILTLLRTSNMQMNRTQAQIIEAAKTSSNPLEMLESMSGIPTTKKPYLEPSTTPPDESRSE